MGPGRVGVGPASIVPDQVLTDAHLCVPSSATGLSGKLQLLVRLSFLANVALCIIKIIAAISSGSFAVGDPVLKGERGEGRQRP